MVSTVDGIEDAVSLLHGMIPCMMPTLNPLGMQAECCLQSAFVIGAHLQGFWSLLTCC